MAGVKQTRARRVRKTDLEDTARPRRAPARSVDLGALADHLGFALRRAQVHAFGRFIEALRPVDLKPAQFSVLLIIHHNPRLQQTDVCSALGIQKANFVPLLNELEARGLVARDVGRVDRRARELSLTPAGETLLARACELQRGYERELTAKLGEDERARLLASLYKLFARS